MTETHPHSAYAAGRAALAAELRVSILRQNPAALPALEAALEEVDRAALPDAWARLVRYLAELEETVEREPYAVMFMREEAVRLRETLGIVPEYHGRRSS